MSDLTLYRMGLTVAELRSSMQQVKAEEKWPENGNEDAAKRAWRSGQRAGLIYAYGRAIDEIEAALEVPSES